MAEIYKNTTTKVFVKLYVNGDPAETEEDVVVNVYDITSDPLVFPPLETDEILISLFAFKSEVDNGSYYVMLPSGFTNRDRKFKLEWVYEQNQQIYYHTTFLDVVTPYVSIEEAIEDLGIGSDYNDPNNKSYHEIRMAEKYARKMIEYYTGQKFYLFDDKITVSGTNSDTLILPKKIHIVHRLHENDQLWIDNLNDINYLGYNLKTVSSGFGIKVDQSSILNNDVYIANGMVPPSIHDNPPNVFKRNKHYDVYARFGWENIPDDVEQAAIEIMRSYFSKDRVWKDKYVNKISTTDWDFQYMSSAFSGTGSSYADKLLADYVVTQMVVI